MTLLLGVLVASVLGSVHCGAMCSVFACLANGGARRGSWYHGGRLGAYVTLGAIAGTFGAGMNQLGLIASVQRTAALMTSVALIVWGALQLQAALQPMRSQPTTPIAARWGGVLARIAERSSMWDPRLRATAIGVTTGLLPCGWLWAFVATAMGTGSAVRGANVMGVFWLGTLPMLLAAVAGVRRMGPIARRRWPIASASLVVALGVGELASHLLMPPMTTPDHSTRHRHAEQR